MSTTSRSGPIRPASGTGTLIDSRGDEILILTCGHIFRDSKGKGPITVDLFAPDAPQGVPDGASNYGRDGFMRFDHNGGRSKNYEPNSFDGPAQTDEPHYAGLETQGVSGSYAWERHAEDDDFAQAVRTAVINKRAGGMGLISGRKAFQRPMAEGVKLLNAIQDVFLDKNVTIA